MSYYNRKSITLAKFESDSSSSFGDMTSQIYLGRMERVVKFGYLPLENGFNFKFIPHVNFCNLSPLLFNIFVNDIFDIFYDFKCCPVKLNNKPITSLMYADDLLILSETADCLKESLQRLGKYAKQWKMKISAKKD